MCAFSKEFQPRITRMGTEQREERKPTTRNSEARRPVCSLYQCLPRDPWLEMVSRSKSWRRCRQNLFVFRIVLGLPERRGHEQQIVVHLVPCEDLAELGDEQAYLQMAGELLQGANILLRSV